MLNLCLHCGAHRVDRARVGTAETPPPTDTWQPIEHERLLREVERTLDGNRLQVVNEAHALSRDGARYFGLLEVGHGREGDYHLVLGLRNSHDKSFPAAIAVGSGVFVCDNLAFSGEVSLARKHTRYIERDLPRVVEQAFGRLGELRDQQDRRIETYRNAQLDDRDVHDLTIRAVDAQVLPVTTIPKVLDRWREPAHPEHAEDGYTAWRYFNAVTEALKGRCLEKLPQRTQSLHGLLDTACGLQPLTSAS